MRFHEMIGLPVYDVETGKRVGKVLDLILNDEWILQGILLEGKHLETMVIKWSRVCAFF